MLYLSRKPEPSLFLAYQDKVRTESYRDFIYQNPHIFQDKVGTPAQKIQSLLWFILSQMLENLQVSCSGDGDPSGRI